jgi:hypothetical protein
MDDLRRRIEAISARAGPVVTLADTDASGMSRAQVRRCESTGITTRIGKSAFVLARTLAEADPWEAFRLRSIGFVVGSGDDVYLAGASAQVVLGAPSLGEPPSKPVADDGARILVGSGTRKVNGFGESMTPVARLLF